MNMNIALLLCALAVSCDLVVSRNILTTDAGMLDRIVQVYLRQLNRSSSLLSKEDKVNIDELMEIFVDHIGENPDDLQYKKLTKFIIGMVTHKIKAIKLKRLIYIFSLRQLDIQLNNIIRDSIKDIKRMN